MVMVWHNGIPYNPDMYITKGLHSSRAQIIEIQYLGFLIKELDIKQLGKNENEIFVYLV